MCRKSGKELHSRHLLSKILSLPVYLCRYVASWIETRSHQSEKANLTILFDKYVVPCLDHLRTSFKMITHIPENSMVQVCIRIVLYLLTCILDNKVSEIYRLIFSTSESKL